MTLNFQSNLLYYVQDNHLKSDICSHIRDQVTAGENWLKSLWREALINHDHMTVFKLFLTPADILFCKIQLAALVQPSFACGYILHFYFEP